MRIDSRGHSTATVKVLNFSRFGNAAFDIVAKAMFQGIIRITFVVIVLPILWLLELVRPIRLGELREDRIGHLASNTELYARHIVRDGNGKGLRNSAIFFAWNPANRQLLEMWKRTLPVVESLWLRRAYLACSPLLEATRFHAPLPEIPVIEPEIFLTGEPVLSFTSDEEERGRRNLVMMGMDEDAWYVCFHARDPSYLATRSGFANGSGAASYFDCSIENFVDAMRLVVELGGYAVRVGSHVETPLPDLGPRVIDYATTHRSDFMDVYLPAHCRFFVGNTSGLFSIARIFNIPVVFTNQCPYPWVGTRLKRNLDIPKLLKYSESGRILSFPEIRNLGLLECYRNESNRLVRLFKEETYEKLGLEWVESDARDIYDACRDMIDKIEGVEPPFEARRLQDAFNELYVAAPASPQKGAIGPRFALRHRDLIEPPGDAVQAMGDRAVAGRGASSL